MPYNYCIMETKRTSFEEFKTAFLPMGCFTGTQVRVWKPQFNRDNLTRWVGQGRILRLRQGLYCFPELRQMPGGALFASQKIYQPSYISLQMAMHFYGIIPEEVVQVTAVTTKKTAGFENALGQFAYHHVASRFMFGAEVLHAQGGGFPVVIATPEKAIVDLLHLNPAYRTVDDMRNLRLDESFMRDEFDLTRFETYLDIIGSPTLTARAAILLETYHD